TVNIKRRMEAKQIAVDTLTVTGITAGSMTASEMASPVGRIDTVISDRMRTAQLSVSGDIEALNGTVRSNEVTTQKIQSGLVETDSLDVNGSMHIKDSLKIGNSIWLGIKNQFTGANNSIYADNGPLYLQSLTHDLYLCGYNNNVMVGFNYCTTTPCNSSVDYPQRRLHITSYQDLSNSSNSSDKEGIRLEKQLFTNVPKFGGTLLQRSTWDFIPVTPVSSTPRLEINSVTGNKNIMTLTEAGNVGIGTNIPQKRMHIKQDDNPTCAASIRLEFDNSVPPNGCGTAHSTWDLNAQGDNVFTITNPSLAQPAMTFLGNGKVGIGTISPLAKLHIESQTGVSPFRITEGATTKFYISDTGSVGIGTAIPQAKLHVAGGNIMWGNSSILFEDQGGSIELGGKNGVAGTGIPYIDFHYNGLSQDYNARIINDANGRLSVDASTLYTTGNVGIGTTLQNNPNNYKLAVNGIIGGKDIWIESTSSAWPDYVLENDYIKLSIPALEAYLKRYKHLPGFLSAVEIKKKGVVSVGETQLLQQKMLEVYALYFIEVDKRITALEEENKILKKLLIEK
ncbi:MAG: hypothetical protein HYY40_08420, partial [Bacteroidetes bacterium]|nr:hypothetical protein [Bacteroidota bacterium]